ncbi:uncharacterized protein FA14DRAFT_179032 [Meira miltonrushii]|uniref:WD40 repeat-like protein n=1 Tax=Meira miltonrushii TaxID=1280837 RepID=A0A316VF29_9BASI|nr:uncharacterized protein FA14DRAFT_179032 [Meira miltonrushii]PWN35668.1 hypothetical protein FA14DRAFT_179032 [Meira miltonrushii]
MADTEMPYSFVTVIADQLLCLVSPLITNFVSLQTGNVVGSITNPSSEAAARCAAAIQVPSASTSSNERLDCLVALACDNKELSVYRLQFDQASVQNASLVKIWSHSMPKRVSKIQWEEDSSEVEKRIVIGDRHGDVRSYIVPISEDELSEPQAKRQKVEESNGEDSKNAEQKMEDEEDSGTLHVGHVSYLTDFVLSSFTSNPPENTPASFLITSDRDEHIRISRWGNRRAGYIALRYLLGSTQAIGGICAIEGSLWQAVQSSKLLNERGENASQFPFLISADLSTLRIWSLHPDSKSKGRKDCLAAVSLEEALLPYVIVDSKKERKRDQMFGKGKVRVPRNEQGAPILTNGVDHVPLIIPIITKIRAFIDPTGQSQLVFTVDGGKALFVISLASLISASNSDEVIKALKPLETPLPILEYTIHQHDAITDVWMVLDVRREFVSDESMSKKPIALARWNEAQGGLSFISKDQHPILQSGALALKASWDDASGMVLYDALTMFTKRDFEYSESVDVISQDGLIKGGLPNHETPGRPASTTNKDQSEKVTRRRELAREEMKKRIESTLNK